MRRLFNRKKRENYKFLEAVERPNSYTTESMQKLIINLEYANVDKKYKVIQLTSTLSGEGKTTLVGNMAVLLAQRNHKVLVMDLDLRKPKIHRSFQIPNDVGLTNYLHGSITLDQAIKETTYDFDVLVSGERTNVVSNLLQSQKLKDLIVELKKEYDYILIDTPPVQVNSDSLMIANLVDGVVYVVGYDSVKKNLVRDSVDELLRHDIPIIGSVLTQVKLARRSMHYNYYYYDEDEEDL